MTSDMESGPIAGEVRPKMRIDWVDVARGMSILFVVLFHASIVLQDQGDLHPLFWKINNLLSPVRMPLFFAVSGMLAAGMIARQDFGAIFRRVRLVWYLYLLWSAIHIVLFGSSLVNSVWQWVASVLLPSDVLWFIWALGLYVLVAAGVPHRHRRLLLIATIVLSASAASVSAQFPSAALYKSILYLPAFLAPCWYPAAIGTIVRRPYSVLCVSGVLFLIAHKLRMGGSLPSVFDVPVGVIGLMVGVTASIVIAKVWYLQRPLSYLGSKTLPVYVAHMPIMKAKAMLFDLPAIGIVGAFTALSVLTLGSIAIALLIRELARRVRVDWLYQWPSIRPDAGGALAHR